MPMIHRHKANKQKGNMSFDWERKKGGNGHSEQRDTRALIKLGFDSVNIANVNTILTSLPLYQYGTQRNIEEVFHVTNRRIWIQISLCFGSSLGRL